MNQKQRDAAFELLGLIEGYTFIAAAADNSCHYDFMERIYDAYKALLIELEVYDNY